MPNFVAEINMDIGYFKNKKIKKKKSLKMASRLKVGQLGEFMGSPCAYIEHMWKSSWCSDFLLRWLAATVR